jgi:hypothetical protein
MCSWAMEVKARIDEALLGFGVLVWIGRAELVEGPVDGVRVVWCVQAGGVSLQQRVHQISRARRVNEGRVRTAYTVYRYTPDLTPKRRGQDMLREGMAVGLMQSSSSCTGSHRFSPARITTSGGTRALFGCDAGRDTRDIGSVKCVTMTRDAHTAMHP